MFRSLEIVEVGLPVALVLRLTTVAVTLMLAGRASWCRRVALGGSIVASAITVGVSIRVLASGTAVDGVLLRHLASAIVFSYSITPLSAWFLLVLGLVAMPVAVYSVGYFAHAVAPSRTAGVCTGLNVLLGALEVVFSASDVIGFLFAWELMTLATAGLVATDHEAPTSRRAAFLYLVMSHVGTGCLVVAFLILAAKSGSL